MLLSTIFLTPKYNMLIMLNARLNFEKIQWQLDIKFPEQVTNAVKFVKEKVTQVMDTLPTLDAAHVSINTKATSGRETFSLTDRDKWFKFYFCRL